jgi:hypothetical protein
MTEAKVVKVLNAPAADVFNVLAVFDGIKAGGPIDSVEYEGEGVGMVRRIGMNGGVIVERLDRHDADTLEMSYAIVNNDSPLPFEDYSATIKVTDNGDNSCTVDWTGTFKAKGDEETAINRATGIYAGGIKSARLALGLE